MKIIGQLTVEILRGKPLTLSSIQLREWGTHTPLVALNMNLIVDPRGLNNALYADLTMLTDGEGNLRPNGGAIVNPDASEDDRRYYYIIARWLVRAIHEVSCH